MVITGQIKAVKTARNSGKQGIGRIDPFWHAICFAERWL